MAAVPGRTRHHARPDDRSRLTDPVVASRNRAVLARQLLLAPGELPISGVLEQMAGLQAQYAPSMYVGLWTRLATFERRQLTEALERREVVQGTLLRATIHLVSARDYWAFAIAVGEARRRWWLALRKGLDARVMERVAAVVTDALADGPLPRREVEALVVGIGGERSLTEGLHLWADLVRVPPSGTWERRRADLYADARRWLGPPAIGLDDAVDHVVPRYLGGFGPAAAKEIATWAGLSVTTVRASLGRLPVHPVTSDDGSTLLDLDGLDARWSPPADAPVPVRFLPTWDAVLLAHARAARLIAEEHRPLVFTSKNPQSVGTFLVDGVTAGTWHLRDGHVHTEPFAPLPRRAAADVAATAARLDAFVA